MMLAAHARAEMSGATDEAGELVARLVRDAMQTPWLSNHRDQLETLPRELFQVAIESGSSELLSVLLQQRSFQHDAPSSDELLRMIVDEGNAELARVLLRHERRPPQPTDWLQRPLLHVAVEQDNAPMVRALLELGSADVNEFDTELHWTALHIAVEWNSVEVEALLIQAGADVNARAKDGCTPLLLAVQHGSTESVALLIDAGADVNATDETRSSALHIAAREGHPELLELLINYGARVDSADHDGRTALHVAAFFDESAARFAMSERDTQVAVVKTLLAHGANADARDAHGHSVLHCAQRWRFDVIVDVLLAHRRSHEAGN